MFERNPVTITEAIKQIIIQGLNTLILFNVFSMTGEQTAAVNVLAGLLLGFVGSLFVRSKVFAPTSKDGDKIVAVQYAGQVSQAVVDNKVVEVK